MAREKPAEGEPQRPGADSGVALAVYIHPIQEHRYLWAGGAVGQKTIGPGGGFSADVGKVVVGAGVGFVWDYDSDGIDFSRGRFALGVTLTFGADR